MAKKKVRPAPQSAAATPEEAVAPIVEPSIILADDKYRDRQFAAAYKRRLADPLDEAKRKGGIFLHQNGVDFVDAQGRKIADEEAKACLGEAEFNRIRHLDEEEIDEEIPENEAPVIPTDELEEIEREQAARIQR